MKQLPIIICTVTNDLSYDQRMQRICNSLATFYEVKLVGRRRKDSIPLIKQNFKQKRLNCFFNTGFLFYAEYNIRLFLFLLSQNATIYYAVDLDTILPNYFVSLLKNRKRVYDAHELFTEQKEIVTRPLIHIFWKTIERFAVAKFSCGYTVNEFIKQYFMREYKVNYAVIRNLPLLSSTNRLSSLPPNNLIICQGSVNEGRCFETLIPAMKKVNGKLLICGNGNYFEQVKELIKKNDAGNKIELKGYLPPEELRQQTMEAMCGLTLFEPVGLNQYYSLSNRFFDYIMAGIPQICIAYPEYRTINNEFEVALLINDTEEDTIAEALNNLLCNAVVYDMLQRNCLKARKILNWHYEEKKLFDYYKNTFE